MRTGNSPHDAVYVYILLISTADLYKFSKKLRSSLVRVLPWLNGFLAGAEVVFAATGLATDCIRSISAGLTIGLTNVVDEGGGGGAMLRVCCGFCSAVCVGGASLVTLADVIFLVDDSS